jgi:hypothetical protein
LGRKPQQGDIKDTTMQLDNSACCKILMVVVLCCVAGPTNLWAEEPQMDVTIYLGGDLLHKGGVVTVYPLPVPKQRWHEAVTQQVNSIAPPEGLEGIGSDGTRVATLLDKPFHQVQFLYPEGKGNFVFRFRPIPAEAKRYADVKNRLLEIGGTDGSTGLGESMTNGFTGLATSGMQTFQINIAASDETAARAMISVAYYEVNPPALACETKAVLAICGYDDTTWPQVQQRWQATIAAVAKEDRRMKALDACYRGAESVGKSGGFCHQLSADSEEAVYEYRMPEP